MSTRSRFAPLVERSRRWWPVAVAVVPILVAAGRAVVDGWVPIGDDAYFTVRSRDVFTRHHPLVGAWSSGSVDLDEPINNLGPLQLDLLAPFTRWWPMSGTAVGVAVVNVVCVVATALLLVRLAGERVLLPSMAVLAVLLWTMGSEMLITPRQHQYLVLPFLLLLVSAWAATAGDRWALVPAVATGSLVAQTHLSYPVLVAALAAPIGVGLAARRDPGDAGRSRAWLVAGGVAAVCWTETLVDQAVGWGNLWAVLSAPGSGDAAGLGTGARIVAGILTTPGALVRPGFRTFDPDTDLPGAAVTVVFLGVVAALAAAAIRLARDRRRTAAAGLAVLVTALVAGIVDAALLPRTVFGLEVANYRWAWAIAAFAGVGVVAALVAHVPFGVACRIRTAAVVVLVLAVLAGVPRSIQYPDPDPAVYRARMATVSAMVEQLRAVDLPTPVIVDERHLYFGHPFTYPALVVLQEQGVDFRFEDRRQARRFGDARVSDGSEPRRFVFWHGDEARARANLPDTIVFVDGDQSVAITLEGA